jgi:hypothetical protein
MTHAKTAAARIMRAYYCDPGQISIIEQASKAAREFIQQPEVMRPVRCSPEKHDLRGGQDGGTARSVLS